MPNSYCIENRQLYRKFSGNITADEVLESNFELQSLAEFKGLSAVINDFTAIDGHSLDTPHAAVFASTDRLIANAKGGMKIALVVRPDDLALAQGYRDAMHGSPFECRIFYRTREACNWAAAE